MKLSDQALACVMVALQKSLAEQTDIVPVLKGFNFSLDSSNDELTVENPPKQIFFGEARNNMPLYTYKCENCEYKFDTVHSITEELHNCESCNSNDTLKRIPQLLTAYSKQKSERDLAGERVRKAIEDNRKLLLDQKEQINRDYKP